MIAVNNVSKWYGPVQAVKDVSFAASPGQVVGLLGPNGAGKTTTIRMITGFLPPSAGTIQVCGHDTIDASLKARRCIGYLPESAPLYPEMSVADYLTYRARLYGMSRREVKAAVPEAARQCWLQDVIRRRIGHLSKGYRQRTGLAAALLHKPSVLVLDEPSNGLDPTQIREMRALIRGLAEERTVLVSSHILPEVERTCDRVIIIARGELRADGTPAELVDRLAGAAPCELEVKIADVPRLLAELRKLPGVAQVQDRTGDDGWTHVSLTPSGAHDLRESAAAAAVAAGATLREVSRARPSLEQLFMRIIEETPAGQEGVAA